MKLPALRGAIGRSSYLSPSISVLMNKKEIIRIVSLPTYISKGRDLLTSKEALLDKRRAEQRDYCQEKGMK